MILTLSDKQFRQEYDKIYKKAQNLFNEYNPCQMDSENCGAKRESNSRLGIDSRFCCSGCRHLRKDGCGVKSLVCKLWICHWVFKYSSAEFLRKRRELVSRANDIGLAGYQGRWSQAMSLRYYQYMRERRKHLPCTPGNSFMLRGWDYL